MRDNQMWVEKVEQPNLGDLPVWCMGGGLDEELGWVARPMSVNVPACFCVHENVFSVSKGPSSMLRIDKDFVISLQSFKEKQ